MWAVIILAVIVVGAGLIVKIFGGEKKRGLYDYRRKEFFMTRAEHELFDILVSIASDKYYIFPQVNLSKLLDHKARGQNWQAAFRHISQKSVDFVICDKVGIKPILAIELDDRSHDREDRQERDRRVEKILQDAKLPLLRLTNIGHFNRDEVTHQVLNAIAGGKREE